MPARRPGRDETRPATRKELLSIIDTRVNSLQRVLVCLERRPELREALSAAIAEEWMRDIGAEPGYWRFPKMDIAVATVIKDLTDMAVDLERVLERETA